MIKCHQYQVNNTQQFKVVGLLHPLDIPHNKSESTLMDFFASLPRTQKGHDVIWVVLVRLTNRAIFFQCNPR